MCGVVAVVSPEARASGGELRRARVEAALVALAHRGPDGRGIWQSSDGRVTLGHARLAVRDREGGAQPLTNEDGRVVASVNGELYRAAALRAELVDRGHRFRARTDSEIVAHAWEEWGPAMVTRLRGEFAFVVWDAREEVLFAARDRFGVKPLAWAEVGGEILVASQARGLFALGLPPAWDRDALLRSAGLQYAGPDSTLFRGARQLPAGHTLTVRAGRAAVSAYWDLEYPRSPPTLDARGEREAVAQVRAAFDEAVGARLEADAPIAFQLSGGLDSSAVVASAARQSSAPVHAFGVSFADDRAYDEASLAAETARFLGATFHPVRVDDRDVADAWSDAVVHAEGICINAHAAAKIHLSAAVRDAGFKVVLTGEGADEVLFGYAHLRSDLEGSHARVAASNAASAGLMLPDGDASAASGTGATEAITRALGFVPTWVAAKIAFGGRVLGLARGEARAAAADHDAARALLGPFDLGRLEGRGRAEVAAYLWSKLALEGYILRSLGDGLEMANGIEGRLPFLDGEFVERVRVLPTNTKIRGGVEKWIFRQAMSDRLPPDVVLREKHPFLAPPAGPRVLDLVRDLTASAAFDAQPLFDRAAVRALFDRWPAMSERERKAHDPVVYFVASIAVLQSRFGLAS